MRSVCRRVCLQKRVSEREALNESGAAAPWKKLYRSLCGDKYWYRGVDVSWVGCPSYVAQDGFGFIPLKECGHIAIRSECLHKHHMLIPRVYGVVVILLYMTSLKKCIDLWNQCENQSYFLNAVKLSTNTPQSSESEIFVNERHLKCNWTSQTAHSDSSLQAMRKIFACVYLKRVTYFHNSQTPQFSEVEKLKTGFWQSPLTNKKSWRVRQCLLHNNFKQSQYNLRAQCQRSEFTSQAGRTHCLVNRREVLTECVLWFVRVFFEFCCVLWFAVVVWTPGPPY